jgi:hypothetical protein
MGGKAEGKARACETNIYVKGAQRPLCNNCSQSQRSAIGFDGHNALAVKGTPGALPFKTSNGEIPAAHNAGRFERIASALDFLRVTRVELKLAKAAVSLAELHRNDAATSLKDEALDDFGVSHEKKRGEARASLKE